ncbi:MAG: sulfurtransferase complex subunit TusB [Gammaproteobacteria bacterium]|nr:sulfurtransferase complex subunit TusB [Gammaproteobacteria bacterium]MDH3859276.1 sulfurtransferase complex subunit TusB [Gammaproteobacteria bacterium]
MSVLHIVNKSPFDRNALDTCLRLAKADSAILLIEDSIYAVRKNSASTEKMQQALASHQIYALKPDLHARGISPENIIDGISLVDYDGFVKLTTEYDKLQSWL